MTEEVRIVNKETGGMKGMKPQRLCLIPGLSIERLASVPSAPRQTEAWLFAEVEKNLDAWWEGSHWWALARAGRALLMLINPMRRETAGESGYLGLEWVALMETGRAYHFGATKYDDPQVGPYNWRRGYEWSLSFDSLKRHLGWWAAGEENDKESGLSHLLHAMWHVLTLLWFEVHHPKFDDRPFRYAERARLQREKEMAA